MNRLIDYLDSLYGHKKSKFLLKNKLVLVNNKIITKFDYVLKDNDKVIINKYNKSDKINIIYEDKDLIVVDKPYNLLTISDGKHVSLYNLVSEYVKINNKNNKIYIIHRLDKDTSGLVMFAKNIKTKEFYQNNWNNVERRYIAIVSGKAKDKDILINNLEENENHFVYVSKKGKEAITEYKKIKVKNNYTYIDINIKTGRKNQIRVQLDYNKTPILGDKKYNGDKYKRLCLHAYKIKFNDKEFISKIPF